MRFAMYKKHLCRKTFAACCRCVHSPCSSMHSPCTKSNTGPCHRSLILFALMRAVLSAIEHCSGPRGTIQLAWTRCLRSSAHQNYLQGTSCFGVYMRYPVVNEMLTNAENIAVLTCARQPNGQKIIVVWTILLHDKPRRARQSFCW